MQTMNDKPTMNYDYAGYAFDWHGGAYIQVYVPGESVPFDVINVWDYAEDKPRIPRTLDAFAERCREWSDDPENPYSS